MLSPKRHANLDEFYKHITVLCMKEPAYLTKYSFAFGLDDVKRDNSYHGQCEV